MGQRGPKTLKVYSGSSKTNWEREGWDGIGLNKGIRELVIEGEKGKYYFSSLAWD